MNSQRVVTNFSKGETVLYMGWNERMAIFRKCGKRKKLQVSFDKKLAKAGMISD